MLYFLIPDCGERLKWETPISKEAEDTAAACVGLGELHFKKQGWFIS